MQSVLGVVEEVVCGTLNASVIKSGLDSLVGSWSRFFTGRCGDGCDDLEL